MKFDEPMHCEVLNNGNSVNEHNVNIRNQKRILVEMFIICLGKDLTGVRLFAGGKH